MMIDNRQVGGWEFRRDSCECERQFCLYELKHPVIGPCDPRNPKIGYLLFTLATKLVITFTYQNSP